MGKTIRASFIRTWMGKKYQIGNVCSFIGNKGYFCQLHVDDIKMAGKKQNLAPTWKKWMKNVDIDEHASFLERGHILYSAQKCSNHEFSVGATEKLLGQQKC